MPPLVETGELLNLLDTMVFDPDLEDRVALERLVCEVVEGEGTEGATRSGSQQDKVDWCHRACI